MPSKEVVLNLNNIVGETRVPVQLFLLREAIKGRVAKDARDKEKWLTEHSIPGVGLPPLCRIASFFVIQHPV